VIAYEEARGWQVESVCQCRTNFPQKRRSKFPQVTVPP
jgi:hypothetical protein